MRRRRPNPLVALASVDDSARDLASRVKDLFGLTSVAEEEIAAAKLRYPDAEEKLHAAFLLLKPPSILGSRSKPYRAHAREILDRVAADQDTRPGTCTEVACALLDSSLKAPLAARWAAVLDEAWRRAFPDSELSEGTSELWAGQVDDDLSLLSAKLSVKDRRIGTKSDRSDSQ